MTAISCGAWTPPDIATPMDDPVISAIARMRGETYAFENDQPSFRLILPLPSGLSPVEIVAMSGTTPMGDGGGFAQVAFGRNRRVLYGRTQGRWRIAIPDDMLPDTILLASPGMRLDAIIDVPGIGHWRITKVKEECGVAEVNLHLEPRPPETVEA